MLQDQIPLLGVHGNVAQSVDVPCEIVRGLENDAEGFPGVRNLEPTV
jgi:hypothetical protein